MAACGDSLAMESSPDAKISIVSGISRRIETSLLLKCVDQSMPIFPDHRHLD